MFKNVAQNSALSALSKTLPPEPPGGDITVIVRFDSSRPDGKMNLMTVKVDALTLDQWGAILVYYKNLVSQWSGRAPAIDDGLAELITRMQSGEVKVDDNVYTS